MYVRLLKILLILAKFFFEGALPLKPPLTPARGPWPPGHLPNFQGKFTTSSVSCLESEHDKEECMQSKENSVN